MTVKEAADVLMTNDPGDISAGTKIRREIVATSDTGREIVVTDSIVFALPEDSNNVLVTAGHTGRSGRPFLFEVSPHGFICSDGGMSKNNAGIAGLDITENAGSPARAAMPGARRSATHSRPTKRARSARAMAPLALAASKSA